MSAVLVPFRDWLTVKLISIGLATEYPTPPPVGTQDCAWGPGQGPLRAHLKLAHRTALDV